jgi:hypothetical protein
MESIMKRTLFALFLATLGAAAFAQVNSLSGSMNSNNMNSPIGQQMNTMAMGMQDPNMGLDVSITLFEKRIYTLDSDIMIQVTLRNRGLEDITLNLADDRKYNLEMDLRKVQMDLMNPDPASTDMNLVLPDSPIVYRHITIQPGEDLSFTEKLSDYVNYTMPGLYRLRVHFFPSLNIKHVDTYEVSNEIVLHIQPNTISNQERAILELESAREEYKRQQSFGPDEVVEYLIESKMMQNQEKFLLYLKLEDLITRNSNFFNEYKNAPENRRTEILREYEDILWDDDSETELGRGEMFENSLSSYEILETRYTPREGRVTAELEFARRRVYFIKEYEFTLKKENDIWMIVQYTVTNKGSRSDG